MESVSVLHGQPWKNGRHCDQASRNVSSLVQPGNLHYEDLELYIFYAYQVIHVYLI